jgi:hypothetical protein
VRWLSARAALSQSKAPGVHPDRTDECGHSTPSETLCRSPWCLGFASLERLHALKWAGRATQHKRKLSLLTLTICEEARRHVDRT